MAPPRSAELAGHSTGDAVKPAMTRKYSYAEVFEHRFANDLWIIIRGVSDGEKRRSGVAFAENVRMPWSPADLQERSMTAPNLKSAILVAIRFGCGPDRCNFVFWVFSCVRAQPLLLTNPRCAGLHGDVRVVPSAIGAQAAAEA